MLHLDPSFVHLLNRFRLTPERLRQRRKSGPGGHLSKGLGQSLDFSEYRPYQPGDDLRALDWKVYGRTDRLYTKLYVPEQEETICFLLDVSGSMAEKWSFCQQVVLGLATVAFAQGDRVALRHLPRVGYPPSPGLPPVRGRSQLAHLARLLESTTPAGITDLELALDEMARRIKTRTHLIVISDFLQPGAGLRGLSQLRYRQHRLSLLQTLAPDELDPERTLSPGEWELFDPEPTGLDESDRVRLDLGRSAFKTYRSALTRHNAQLSSFAKKYQATYVLSDTSESLITYFSESLRRGGVLV